MPARSLMACADGIIGFDVNIIRRELVEISVLALFLMGFCSFL